MEYYKLKIILACISLLFLSQVTSSVTTCTKYSCGTEIGNNACAYLARSLDLVETIYLYPCSEGYSCDMNKTKLQEETIIYCTQSTQANLKLKDDHTSVVRQLFGSRYNHLGALTPTLYPGENCTDNVNCTSSNCTSGYCIGKEQNTTCEFDAECNPGLYCNSNTTQCESQVQIGKNCSSTEKCVNWGLCNNGLCVQKRSLNLSSELEDTNLTELCYHNFSITQSSKLQCGPGPFLSNTHAQSSSSNVCTYYRLASENSSSFATESPTCGHGETQNSFCRLRQGDEGYTQSLQLTHHFWAAQPQCHLMSPLTCEAAKNTKGYWTLLGSAYELENYAELQSTPTCYKNMSSHSYYWNTIRPNMITELAWYDSASLLRIGALGLIAMASIFLS